MSSPICLAVETGGTKILARLAEEGRVLAEARWTTTTPKAALEAIVEWAVSTLPDDRRIAAIGIAAFGPLLLDPSDPRYGEQLETVKRGWTGSNLGLALSKALAAPVAIDTDVNAAARAERMLGAGRGLGSIAYLTIGTGIGAGLASRSGTLRGAMHPEVGHLRLARRPDDAIASACPFHSDCAEGLAAGPAVRKRLGKGGELADHPEVATLTAGYIAQVCAAIVLVWSPSRIIIGGGVGAAPGMLESIRSAVPDHLGGYGVGDAAGAPDFIAPATLHNAGLEGALLMARELSCPAAAAEEV